MANRAGQEIRRVDRGDRSGRSSMAKGRSAGDREISPLVEWFGNLSCWGWSRRDWACNLAPPAIALLIVAPICVALFDRAPPFQFVSGVITPRPAFAGSTVTVTWEVKNEGSNECGGTVYRVIVDAKGTQWQLAPSDAIYARVRRGNTFSVNFTLPEFMAHGPAVYHSLPRYWCNWAQRIWPVHGDAPPITFNVISGDR